MNQIKKNPLAWILCVVELALGILLLVNVENLMKFVVIVAGAAMIVFGIIWIIRYFRQDAAQAVLGYELTKGLIAIGIGVFCIFNTKRFIETFALFAVLFGLLVLLAGFIKIQTSVDLLRLKKSGWWLTAIGALLTIVFAIIILANPFKAVKALGIFIGITLIVEAVLDAVGLFLLYRTGAAEKI